MGAMYPGGHGVDEQVLGRRQSGSKPPRLIIVPVDKEPAPAAPEHVSTIKRVGRRMYYWCWWALRFLHCLYQSGNTDEPGKGDEKR